MIKSWLIKTEAPFFGTEQYYGAYAEDENKLRDWLYENWFDEECQNLWDNYSYLGHYDEEFEDDDSSNELDYDDFINQKYKEWCEDCSLSIEECPEKDFTDYTPEGCEMEIIYDER